MKPTRILRARRFLCALFTVALTCAAEDFAIRQGDVVVFFGDSITESQLYTNFVETYAVTRFPTLGARFINAGWSGDTVFGGGGGSIDERLLRDVVAQNPTMAVVMLGMNDVLLGAPPDPTAFGAGLQHIVDYLRANVPGIRITLVTPSPYDDVTRPPAFTPGYGALVAQFAAVAARVAADNGLLLADSNAALGGVLQAVQAANPAVAPLVIPDRIHPALGGALVVAGSILKAWHAPPVVSRVEIDAGSTELLNAVNTSVSDLQSWVAGDRKALAWAALDGALPLISFDVRDPVTVACLTSSNLLQGLGQQTIRIANLPPGRYRLRIDEQDIGEFTADEFAMTIDLAGLPTPMSAHALRVHAYTQQHNQLHYARWRQIQIPYQTDSLPSYDTALGAVDRMEDDILTVRSTVVQPVVRRFTITPVPAPN